MFCSKNNEFNFRCAEFEVEKTAMEERNETDQNPTNHKCYFAN